LDLGPQTDQSDPILADVSQGQTLKVGSIYGVVQTKVTLLFSKIGYKP